MFRRLLFSSAFLGIVLAGVAVALDASGLLDGMERHLYDSRARHFQFFAGRPTNKLLHLDIDDGALQAIGYWPWPRNAFARIVDELDTAGAKVIALDVLFAERQPPEYKIEQTSGGPSIVTSTLDHDQLLADSIRRAGKKVVLGTALTITPRDREPSALYLAMCSALQESPTLNEEDVAAKLREQGFDRDEVKNCVNAQFIPALHTALFGRICIGCQRDAMSVAELRARLMPGLVPGGEQTPLERLFNHEWARAQNAMRLTKFKSPVSDSLRSSLLSASDESPPIAPLSDAAAYSGSIDYLPLHDGTLRSVPMGIYDRDGMMPQFGLAMVCAMLDVDVRDPAAFQVGTHEIRLLPRSGSPISVPVWTDRSSKYSQPLGLMFDVPWFGTENWETMYDYPRHAEIKQHFSVKFVWRACDIRMKIEANNAVADHAIAYLHSKLGNDHPYMPAAADQTEPRYQAITTALEDPTLALWLREIDVKKPELRNSDDDDLQKAVHDLRALRGINGTLEDQLRQIRRELRDDVDGRAVIVGWAASASGDSVQTSIHPSCPGSVIHGVIFNAIMTGRMWKRGSARLSLLLTLTLGLLTALAVRMTPLKSLGAALLILIIYTAINCLLLFDYGHLIIGLTGPMVAVGLVWSGCTVARFVNETSERTRVTGRFRSYVDPTLVNYVIAHRDRARLRAEVCELTVCFSDLAGFTTLSEKMGRASVPLISRYMSLMVPIIRAHRGYVNKFLGDGIMFFYGAPVLNAEHAADAVLTTLEMQAAMDPFNKRLAKRGLPLLSMRIGICTGVMTVGDAGPPNASDYTVLGDKVNLGSRLEGANKAFGSSILMSARTTELLGDRFVVRPIGKVCVVGKSEGIMIYEPLALRATATEAQQELAKLTTRIVETFVQRRFEDSLQVQREMEQRLGPSKLISVYGELCDRYLKAPPASDFDGQINLSEK